MGDFHPDPWQIPPVDGVQRPVSVSMHVVLPPDASAADMPALHAISNGIVDYNRSRVHRFMSTNRQQNSLSGRAYDRRIVHMDGMNARWQINNGQETLHLKVFPSHHGPVGSLTIDTNLDGYVIWVHVDPNYPDPGRNNVSQSPGPYLIAMNGYIIEQAYQPQVAQTRTGGYPILFGRTALLCSSYVGDVEKQNPLLVEKSLKPPFPVRPANGWGNYLDAQGPTGVDQPKIPKTLGYWLFDWFSVHNPGIYVGGQNWSQALAANSGVVPGAPTFDKGMYFRNAAKSPLNPRGSNSITVLPVQFGQQTYAQTYDLFFAEFYDRGAYRVATQSWTIPAAPGRGVLVNDKPLIYAAATLGGQSL